MKSTRSTVREGRLGLGWLAILAPLVLGFVVSVFLAYQAFDANRQHRATARATAREHAGFAAFLIASSVDRAMRQTLLYSFYPVDLARDGDPESLPHPSILRTDQEADRCAFVTNSDERRFFRYDLETSELLIDGPSDADFDAWLSAALATNASSEARGPQHLTRPLTGYPIPIAYRVWTDTQRSVAYGFESCWRTEEGNAFTVALSATQALPPSLVGQTSNDSLFALAARDGLGQLAFGETWARPRSIGSAATQFYGTAPVQPTEVYAGLEVRVTLLPAVAEQLIQGGLPRSRLPLALGLLALTGALMGVAVAQLRRGHALVTARSRFVRNVSHELRTPLQQILLFTELLQSDRLVEETKRREALDIMHAETLRLIHLAQNVLRFSSKKSEPSNVSRLNLSVLVEGTVQAFLPLAHAAEAEVRLIYDDSVEVSGDADGLRRVLVNLLDNAVKYGPKGQTIDVTVRADKQWGEVTVCDQGAGIPERDRVRIWEPFSRLEREEGGSSAGSGIGLSIVRSAVQGMGGQVDVAGGVNGGACFNVRLPLISGGS